MSTAYKYIMSRAARCRDSRTPPSPAASTARDETSGSETRHDSRHTPHPRPGGRGAGGDGAGRQPDRYMATGRFLTVTPQLRLLYNGRRDTHCLCHHSGPRPGPVSRVRVRCAPPCRRVCAVLCRAGKGTRRGHREMRARRPRPDHHVGLVSALPPGGGAARDQGFLERGGKENSHHGRPPEPRPVGRVCAQ